MPQAIVNGVPNIIVGTDQRKCRVGVYIDAFDNAVQQLERTPTRSMGGIDPCVAGGFRAGHVRAGVKLPIFDGLIEQLEKTPTPRRALVGKAPVLIGSDAIACRVGVFTEDWDRAVSRFEG